MHCKEQLTDVCGFDIIILCMTELFGMNQQIQCSKHSSLELLNIFQSSFNRFQLKFTLLLTPVCLSGN